MDAKLSGKFPYPLDGIEIRAVRRQVIKVELRFMFLTPSAVKFGVVVFCVVGNDDHAASAFETAAMEQTQEIPCAHRVKAVVLACKEKFAVAKTHRTKITYALARGMMLQHGIFDLRWNPHPTADPYC